MATPRGAIERLMQELGRLPGIGPRTSERLAWHLVSSPEEMALDLADAIRGARQAIQVCSICCNLDTSDPCGVCGDGDRDAGLILVLEDARDVARFEAAGHQGRYHILQGRVCAQEGIGPDDLSIDQLLARVRSGGVREVCLATNPDLEGEGTAAIVAQALADEGVAVTRLARGLPAGANISQVSQSILADAIDGRRPLAGGDDAARPGPSS